MNFPMTCALGYLNKSFVENVQRKERLLLVRQLLLIWQATCTKLSDIRAALVSALRHEDHNVRYDDPDWRRVCHVVDREKSAQRGERGTAAFRFMVAGSLDNICNTDKKTLVFVRYPKAKPH